MFSLNNSSGPDATLLPREIFVFIANNSCMQYAYIVSVLWTRPILIALSGL